MERNGGRQRRGPLRCSTMDVVSPFRLRLYTASLKDAALLAHLLRRSKTQPRRGAAWRQRQAGARTGTELAAERRQSRGPAQMAPSSRVQSTRRIAGGCASSTGTGTPLHMAPLRAVSVPLRSSTSNFDDRGEARARAARRRIARPWVARVALFGLRLWLEAGLSRVAGL
jgi:hypothetical protein